MVYDEIERARARLEARLTPEVAALFARQGGDLVRLVRQGDGDFAEAVAADEAVAFEAVALVWAAAAAPFARATYDALASDAAGATKAAPPAATWLERAVAFVSANGGAMVRAIAATVLDDLRAVLAAGLRDGAGTDALARALAEAWPAITARRAERIVRTEVVGASNAAATWGAERAAADFGLDVEMEWLATRDGRTREAHRAADGQRAPLGGAFAVGGHAAAYPGDPALPASMRVNCRCAVAPVPLEAKAKGPPTWREERDEAIRAAYEPIKAKRGAEVAYALLGEEHGLQPDTVRKIVHRLGPYA